MAMRAKILVIDHDDTSLENLGAHKEEVVNQAFAELEAAGHVVIQVSETVAASHYSLFDRESGRDFNYQDNGTLITILYQEKS